MGQVGKETGKFSGKRLREAREAVGLTQDQLAEKVEITQGYLSQIESEKATPTLGHLWSLARAVGVKMSALFGETE